MRLYEGLFAFPTNTAPEDRKDQEKKVETLIENLGGKVQEKTEFGKRSFGYEVKKSREGHFVLFHIEIEPGKIDELHRSLRLSSDLLKFIVTKKQLKKQLKPARKKTKPAKVAAVAAE